MLQGTCCLRELDSKTVSRAVMMCWDCGQLFTIISASRVASEAGRGRVTDPPPPSTASPPPCSRFAAEPGLESGAFKFNRSGEYIRPFRHVLPGSPRVLVAGQVCRAVTPRFPPACTSGVLGLGRSPLTATGTGVGELSHLSPPPSPPH